MCTNSRPSARSHPAMRPSRASWLRTCSNISTDTQRSKAAGGSSSALTSQVTTRTLCRPRSRQRASIQARCEAELDTAVMRARG